MAMSRSSWLLSPPKNLHLTGNLEIEPQFYRPRSKLMIAATSIKAGPTKNRGTVASVRNAAIRRRTDLAVVRSRQRRSTASPDTASKITFAASSASPIVSAPNLKFVRITGNQFQYPLVPIASLISLKRDGAKTWRASATSRPERSATHPSSPSHAKFRSKFLESPSPALLSSILVPRAGLCRSDFEL